MGVGFNNRRRGVGGPVEDATGAVIHQAPCAQPGDTDC